MNRIHNYTVILESDLSILAMDYISILAMDSKL